MPSIPATCSNSREHNTTAGNVNLFQAAAASSRRFAKPSLLAPLVVVVACSGAGGAETTACPDNAQQYWTAFRAAALRGDAHAVSNTTRFPFVVNAVLDESEAQHIARKDFPGVFPKLLEADPGTSPTPTTMKSFLSATPRLSHSFCNTHGNQFRVGAWVFELTSHGWLFVQAFVDE